MPLGESVGTAYVRLIADGSGVPDDVKKALDELEPTLKDAGEKHAAAYDKAFDKQYEKDNEKFRSKATKDLEKGLGQMAATGRIIGEKVGDNLFEGIEKEVSRRFDDPDLGRRVRLGLEKAFANDQSLDRLRGRLRNINQEVIRASKTIEDDLQKSIRDTIKDTDNLVDSTQKWLNNTDKAARGFRKAADTIGEAVSADHLQMLRNYTNEFHDLDKESTTWTARFRNGMNEVHGRLVRFNAALDETATRTGKAFGKDSRNDFVHAIGSMIEGLNRVIATAPKAAEKLAGLFSGGGGGGLDFGKLAANGAAGLSGIAIAIGALAVVAGPVASIISGIGAAIISLAGSLAFAAGAIGGVAAGLTGVLVPAVGVALLAFTHLGDEGTKAINKIRGDLGDLGKVAGDAIGPGLTKAANTLGPIFRRLTPLVEATSGAIGNVIASLAQVADSPAFRKFTNAFETFLPRAINQLGTAVGQLAEGLLGVFRSAIPITQEFLDWLVKITREFSEWANSAKGQNELKKFFDDAADSAKAVWDFVVQLGDAIGELLSAGKDTGDSLFQSAADSLRDFVQWLQDPKNQKSIQDFFTNGAHLARQLSDAIIVIGDAIGKMDSAASQSGVTALFTTLEVVIGAVAWQVNLVWSTMGRLFNLIGSSGGFFQGLASGAADFGRAIGKAAEDTARLIRTIVTGPKRGTDWLVRIGDDAVKASIKAINAFAGLGPKLANKAGNFIWSRVITNYVPRVVGWFGGLARRLVNAAGNFIWSGVITNYVPRVVGWFAGMAGRLARAAGNFAWNTVIKNYVPTVLGWFSDLAHRLVNAVGNFDWSSIITNPTDTILGWFRDLHDDIQGLLHFSASIDWPGKPSWLDKVTATGGVFAGAQTRIIGEAGPEAVVPLNRPLNMVDPSVRWLSAIAQGKQMAPGEGAPTQSGRSVSVSEGAITVVEAANGVATAQAVLNALVARAV